MRYSALLGLIVLGLADLRSHIPDGSHVGNARLYTHTDAAPADREVAARLLAYVGRPGKS